MGCLHVPNGAERIAAVLRYWLIVIVIGVAVGVYATFVDLYYVAAAILGCILAVIAVWQDEAVVTLYVAVAFVVWGQTPGMAVGGSGEERGLFVSEILLIFLIFIFLIRSLLSANPLGGYKNGLTVPILIYLAFSVVNVFQSYVFWDPNVSRSHQHIAVNAIALGFRFLSAGALLIVARGPADRRWLRRMTVALWLPGGVLLGFASWVDPSTRAGCWGRVAGLAILLLLPCRSHGFHSPPLAQVGVRIHYTLCSLCDHQYGRDLDQRLGWSTCRAAGHRVCSLEEDIRYLCRGHCHWELYPLAVNPGIRY